MKINITEKTRNILERKIRQETLSQTIQAIKKNTLLTIIEENFFILYEQTLFL